MTVDFQLLGDKLSRYRNQFQYSLTDVARSTGIDEESLGWIECAKIRPTGDQILILADFYKCDYKFFLSNEENLCSFEQTEMLFRKFGDDFSSKDRLAVQECLYLAECELYLEQVLDRPHREYFSFTKIGNHFKTHGQQAAAALRQYLQYSENAVSMNIYEDMRKIGIRVFRRKLENSNISGVCIKHPVAGKCVLINYKEDIYRQRFTAAHETAHTILDDDEDIIVSFTDWKTSDLKEIRANTFASSYLIPKEFLVKIPDCRLWTQEKAIEWANRLKVSTQALSIALSESKLIPEHERLKISSAKVPWKDKEDPELPEYLPERSRKRKRVLLEHGLSNYYVSLGFQDYRENLISASRLSEMLLLENDYQLFELADIYGERINYGC